MMSCVICLKPEVVKYKGAALLEAQCSVIFFLKEFLHCESQLNWNLQEFLVKYGNPSEWIQFCSLCSKWVEEGRRVHTLLQQLQVKLSGLKVNFVDTVKKTSGAGDEKKVKVHFKDGDLVTRVREEILRTRTPSDFGGPEGDNGINPLAKVKVEMEDEEEIADFEDFMTTDFDDEDQLDNVIHPEVGESNEEDDPDHDTRKGVDGYMSSDSDKEFTPKKSKSKTKKKSGSSAISGEEENHSGKKKQNGPKKTPVEARTCPICSVVLDKPSLLQRHVNSAHTRMVEINCDTCGKGFIRKDSLKKHICPNIRKDEIIAREQKVSNDSRFRKRKSTNKSTEDEDIDIQGGTSNAGFPISNDEDSDNDNSGSEMEGKPRFTQIGSRKSPIEMRTCPICAQVFDRPSFLTKHLRSKNFKNGICGGGDNRQEDVQCPVCSESFESKSSFSTHFQSHTIITSLTQEPTAWCRKSPESTRTCPHTKCAGKVFPSPSKLKLHLIAKHKLKKLEETSDTDEDSNDPLALGNEDDQDSDWEEKNKPHSNKKPTASTFATVHTETRKSPAEMRTCPICVQVFDRPSFLAKHLRSKNFKVGNCGDENAAEQDNLSQSIKCPVCSETFESRSSFAAHFHSHTTALALAQETGAYRRKSPASARTCPHPECEGKVFQTPSKLSNHLTIRHRKIEEDESFKCSYCPKTFPKKAYLKDHEWNHLTPDKKLSYLKSMRSKVSLKDKTCPVCNLVFLSISRMKVHLNIRHEKKHLWSCDVCSKGFTRKDSYEEHLKTHLDSEQREKLMSGVPVSVPSTQSPQKSVTLKMKVRNSGSITHRSCPACGRVFANRSRMTQHLKTVHEKSTATICEICGVSIGCKQTLRLHMKNHEKEPGVKDYLCSDCGRAFRHRYSLRRHQLVTHNAKTDLRKFPCSISGCGKAYPFHSLLVQHQKARRHVWSGGHLDDPENSSSSSNAVNRNDSTSGSVSYHQNQFSGHNYTATSFAPHWNIL